MKPRKPFMIERTGKNNGDDFAVVAKDRPGEYHHVDWVDWDGTQFATRDDAEAAIRTCGYKSAQVIEILDQIRTTIRR